MDKICASPEAALADLCDGASIAVSGFGTSYGFACSLLVAARDKGVKNLTLVSNGLGAVGTLRGMLLVGEIPAERVGLPGILVTRIVQKTVEPDQGGLAPRRAADKPREYNGKVGWTRDEMARRTAVLLAEGSYVNLGTGIPTLVSNYIEGRDITLHGENGILGYGQMVQGDQIDHDVFNASGQYVSALPGTSYFDSVTSFEMARSGKLNTVILGAYQVDQDANLANFS